MELITIVIALALLEYLTIGALVGAARGRYGVKAPATSGHDIFDRYFRVQQNTLELMVAFVPAIWLFGLYVSTTWGALLGVIFIVGRIVYFKAYIADPSKRSLGFGLSLLPVVALAVGALIAAGMKLLVR